MVEDWYKMKDLGIITNDKKDEYVELQWYQCKNIGKIEWKVKRYLV